MKTMSGLKFDHVFLYACLCWYLLLIFSWISGFLVSRGCSSGQHNCSQLCVDGVDGPFCACSPRYYLGPDERTCLRKLIKQRTDLTSDMYVAPMLLIAAKCSRNCNNNGMCIVPDVCQCAPGFTYVDCRVGQSIMNSFEFDRFHVLLYL